MSSSSQDIIDKRASCVSIGDSVTVPLPPRFQLDFPIDLDSVGVGFQNLVLSVKEVAESTLYDWLEFPVALPPTAFSDDAEKRKAKLNQPLFKAPDFDELTEVAHDEQGNRRYLSPEQLDQLHRCGQFDVDSVKFIGEKHTWKLTRLLQNGTENTLRRFWKDIGWAARFLFEWGRNRLISKRFSALSALRNIVEALVMIIDLAIGIPHTNHGNMERKLEEERRHYLICELSVKPKKLKYLEEYWEQYEALMFVTADERKVDKIPVESLRLPPYRYITPGKLPIDLRLLNATLQERCFRAISDLDQVIREDWFQQFKDQRVTVLREEGKSQLEIREIIQEEAQREYLKVLFEAMRQSDTLSSLEPTIIEPLIDLARYNAICETVMKELEKDYTTKRDQLLSELKTQHPVMSQVGPWRRRKERIFEANFYKKHEFTLHDRLHERLLQERLDQYAYFIQRDRDFLATRRPLLQKALLKKSYPDGEFHISFRSVFPRCWQVMYHDNGETYRVDLVYGQPPEPNDHSKLNYQRPLYTLCKKVTYHSNTSWPFWRWRHFAVFTYVWILRLLQLLVVSIPFGSPVSFTALFRVHQFYPHYGFNGVNGHVYRDRNRPCRTLCSRLRGLWHHIWKSRRQFEAKAMTGLLDKSVVRHFHRFWCYGVQGLCGTLLIVLIMPPVCIFASTLSMILGITAPLWFFLASLFAHLGLILFYDVHKKTGAVWKRLFPLFDAFFFRFLIRGVFALLLCLLLSFVFLPSLALVCSVFAVLRWALRHSWDAAIFYAILRRKARVPVRDDFMAIRVSGPGLLSNYCYQARIDQALLALLIELEKTELDLWSSQYELVAKEPEENFKDFVKRNFTAFSLGLLRMGRYLELVERQQRWLDKIRKEESSRKTLLNELLTLRDLHRVKLTSRDLNTLMDLAEKIVSEFYTKRILLRLMQLKVDEKTWWQKEHRLGVHDYSGYAASIFTKIFGEQFFVSLEESTKVFQLEVDHVDVESYLEMLETSAYRLDLDQVTPRLRHDAQATEVARVGFHRHCYMFVAEPVLKASYFAPQTLLDLPVGQIRAATRTRYSRKRWNKIKCLSCWMTPSVPQRWEVEVKLYHPAIIGLLIHKRERESVNLDVSAYWVQSLAQRIINIGLVSPLDSSGEAVRQCSAATTAAAVITTEGIEGSATITASYLTDMNEMEAQRENIRGDVAVLDSIELSELRREEMLMVTEDESTTMTSEDETATPT